MHHTALGGRSRVRGWPPMLIGDMPPMLQQFAMDLFPFRQTRHIGMRQQHLQVMHDHVGQTRAWPHGIPRRQITQCRLNQRRIGQRLVTGIIGMGRLHEHRFAPSSHRIMEGSRRCSPRGSMKKKVADVPIRSSDPAITPAMAKQSWLEKCPGATQSLLARRSLPSWHCGETAKDERRAKDPASDPIDSHPSFMIGSPRWVTRSPERAIPDFPLALVCVCHGTT